MNWRSRSFLSTRFHFRVFTLPSSVVLPLLWYQSDYSTLNSSLPFLWKWPCLKGLLLNEKIYLQVPTHPFQRDTSLIIVSPPLSTFNYHSWSQSMRVALLLKNKLQFIDENTKTLTNPIYLVWECCYNLGRS